MASRSVSKSTEIVGLGRLERRLKSIIRHTDGRALERPLMAAAEIVRQEIEDTAPRSNIAGGSHGHGHAADHIGKVVRPSSTRNREVDVGPESDFWYLVFPELGTPYQPALAPMRRAAANKFDEASVEFTRSLRQQIEGIL